MHRFEDSRAVEARWEGVLDAWLRADGRDVRPATMAEQWKGIDRVVTDENGEVCGIEYKIDEVARRTGNIFVETVSNDNTGRPGWAYTSTARWIFYFIVPDRVLCLLTERLRAALPAWLRRFRLKSADNGDYRTVGVVVPIVEAEKVAEQASLLPTERG
mgnify:FL=1